MEKIFEDIATKYREREGNIIFLLQETQEAFGYIPREAVDFFSHGAEYRCKPFLWRSHLLFPVPS